MDLNKQKGKNVGVVKDIFNKFKYSFQGIGYCFKNETSFIFQAIAIVLGTVLAIVFKISLVKYAISMISLLNIMVVELLNTGIEATVDMVTKEFNPYAKIAKDCGSGATCIATFIATIVNLIIFLPYIIDLFVK